MSKKRGTNEAWKANKLPSYLQANKQPIQLRSYPKRFMPHDFSNKI